MKKNHLSYFSLLKKTYSVLSPNQRKKSFLIFLTTLINGFLDVFGLALIIPVIYLINDTPQIHSNKYLSHVYEVLNFKDDTSFLLFFIIIITLIFLLKNIISLGFNYIQQKYIFNIGRQITLRQYKKYLFKDYLEVSSTNSNKMVQEVVRVPFEFAKNILSPILFITTEYFVIGFIVIGIIIYDFKVVILLVTTLFPIIFLLNKFTKNRINYYGNERHRTQIKTFKDVIDSLHAYIDVKLTNHENYFISKSSKTLGAYYNVIIKLSVLQKIPVRLIESTAIIGIAILFFSVNYLLNEPDKIVAILILFATASYRLLPSLNRVISDNMLIKSSLYVFETIKPYKDTDDIKIPQTKYGLDFKEYIELKNIYFKYPEKDDYALNNVTIKILKGQTIGLVGESGSGKSTMGKLLLRLINEEKGSFVVDGKQIDEKQIPSWNFILGYVQQDFYLLDSTLAENIAFGIEKDKIDYKKVHKVIEEVRLKEVVEGLKDGVNTVIGEFGGKLSGGQRQRIAIARALYKDAKILLFDEATSALDSTTEKEIMKTLYDLRKLDLTLIIIAHRTTTLESCDFIYEMKDGTINNKLTYNQLLEKELNTTTKSS